MTATIRRKARSDIHIPYLSEDEKIFLNTTATYSQVRRMSTTTDRPSIEEVVVDRRPSISSSLAFLWGGNSHHNKASTRRGSSSSTLTHSSSTGSMDDNLTAAAVNAMVAVTAEDHDHQRSPKARELESLIFTQPQRTVRLSLTPRCAV